MAELGAVTSEPSLISCVLDEMVLAGIYVFMVSAKHTMGAQWQRKDQIADTYMSGCGIDALPLALETSRTCWLFLIAFHVTASAYCATDCRVE